MYPLKFEPILKQTLWGGDKIIPFKHLNETLPNVGESWEVSAVEGSESVVANGADKGYTLPEMVRKYKDELVGEANYARFGNKFPLLIKFIDAKLDLSIQVHPDDELAKKRHNSFGKNEMWYVIAADKGAKLISGFSEQITPKEYKDRVHNGTFAEVLQTCAIEPGDVFYVPAGRVHGIGAGAFVAEIQQTSDITYRIFDYNRKDKDGKSRELHTSQAIDAINFTDVQDDFRTEYDRIQNEPVEMVASPYFTTSVYDMTEEITCDYSELDSFVIFICVEGACRLTDDNRNEITMCAGETVLLPASTQEVTIVPEGERVKLLETYV
ncbi:type I phosphomannose isomerase catalytic subunit [Bacteroides eggerthii]|uniref:Phosphohexomutase n=1 Tax=Bacteroides eggerthii TaxID=28111 RepID=A0A380YKT0_9BACE|nr:type I phosphomannose isomerase catalytic subunit [Bacteroides eggerthii]EEC54150.1 mannose-6-phosphate isomerase, class I [Bacteroides eggerthii DSM 20697]QRQ48068.1 class I mannose-6-phosphate isomerase [Bacteroides eggerthii]UWN86375.1 class I mannose-6-phosphate isomerase [Bacteroides eggerthii]SUV28736.1 mannose-6-phosphate isomerase [Bacteroides eggerthii]